MKILVRILLIYFILSSNVIFGQGQAGIWYFGDNAGLDFNVDPVVALTDGSLDTDEGCATVCTAQGDLLFYTDGVTVYNKNHDVMTNGTGLDGNASATQSSIIVQQPGSSIIYYIFTVDAHQNALRNGFNYSEVDMSQDGGLGAVTVKNSVIYADEVCEKVTAVAHANGTDYWILMHAWDTRDFYAYQFSASGLSTPVISTVGVLHNSDQNSAIGYMKISPSGSKLALAIYTQNLVELFDFNTSSGVVSNPIQLNNYTTPYGIEFSPSGEFLYVSLFLDGELYQFNISSNDETTINASSQLVGSGSWLYGALQLAPDNRIYMAKIGTNGTTGSLNLDVLNSPDVAGTGVDFVADSQNLSGRRSRLGLPNFVTSIFTLEFAYQYDCLGDDTEFTIVSDLSNIADASWDFGDGNSETSTTSPFTVNHVYATADTFTVSLQVNLISGGSDTISQSVIIRSLPVVTDQSESVWEDTQGSEIASGIDLTLLESAINSTSGSTFVWYSDATLDTLVADPTSVSVINGQQFWVDVNDGFCSNVAMVTYTVNSLPQAIDQDIVLCEDNYNSGNVSNIDLTLLESAITNNNPYTVAWFHDLALTQPVTNTTSRVVSNGEVFYAQVSIGTNTSVATVTYTINTLPEGNDIEVQLWEDTFGSGSVAGINLTDYDTQVAGSNNVAWFSDASLSNSVTDPTNIFVNDQDTYYAYIDNGLCNNVGSLQFTVRSTPIANDLDLDICEDVYGGGVASNVNLPLNDSAINGGTLSSVSWYEDAALTSLVSNPSSVTVVDGQAYYVLVQEGAESNSATVIYSLVALPIANNQSIVEFEDVVGSMISLGVDLSFYNDAILGGESNSLEWYYDSSLTNLVADPTSQDVADGDIFYVLVSNGLCSNVATVDFSVVNTPVAKDVFPEVCEDIMGSGTAIVDLSANETQINEGNGDSFAWYFDWPTEPNGTPVNLIPDPTSVSTGDGDRFFAAVSDAFNTNIAVATYSVLSLPVVSDQNVEVWEDSFGSGVSSGINLSTYNSVIASASGLTVLWYQDALLTNLVVTPDNVSLVSGDAFYALVDDGNCQSSAILTFTVRNLPEANDLQVQLCEDILGTASITSYDLSQLENSVNSDPGTVKDWFYDAALTSSVVSPMNTTVSDGDSFFVRVSFGTESNVAQVDFTINSIPDAKNDTITLCEDVFNTGEHSRINLNEYKANISSSASSSLLWYFDSNYSNPVSNVQNVLVSNGDVFYARVWDGTCENFAELTFNITTLPQTLNVSEDLCEQSFASSSVSGVNLTDFNSEVCTDSLASLQWFEDDQLIIPVTNSSDVTVSNQSSYYALAVNQNGCESIGRLNFVVNSLPEANDLTIDLCEDNSGEGIYAAYDLTVLNDQVTNNSSYIVSWYQDIDLLTPVPNPLETTISSNDSFYAKIENGCSNSSLVNFIIHEKPVLDLGRDTTILYGESKILSPVIENRFLPGTYLWQDGSTNSTYTAYEEGMYELQYTDFNGCISVDSIFISVDRYRIFVPNAFTPNGDGVNDTFGPIITGDIAGEEIEMFVYNRWGELIYEFTDLGRGWDGTYKGKNVKMGVYVWILLVKGKARKDGNVSLIR
ncbi:gliding motility-associated C-terminal domain-containing protein [Labilibaculum sp.]|uniref:T9SS type B sorting domain-containing protein n=1 Tax=Labilibaculum sp. TaxID=2060723 RepID=UPI003563D049